MKRVIGLIFLYWESAVFWCRHDSNGITSQILNCDYLAGVYSYVNQGRKTAVNSIYGISIVIEVIIVTMGAVLTTVEIMDLAMVAEIKSV